MARKVLVRLVDDLDGLPGDDVATVTFALDGVTYEIDLNEANADRLRDGLADYVAAARRTGGRARRGAGRPTSRTRSPQAASIREWARQHGHDLAERGRIPAHVVAEYEAAARGTGTSAKRVKTAAAAKPATGKTTARTAKSRTARGGAAKSTKSNATSRGAGSGKGAEVKKASRSRRPGAGRSRH